ncbi:chloramphenicol acetyltransferase [Mucilaginibacter achroorhodeus]|uniref:Chloramphenicol acetyltransferase n=1 Tax=Mucilaginibacter achroorhodeus TaxID=2599294 RepID=A0A563U6W4_9SPHI|nr:MULTISPECIES: CatA-like O-acetyltransferase [Mucilaginibacter]QXV64937.1 chloramphenicol acetyltransferase [Mucilaginibacter sp. 21P]TWR27088.1 chloramphenicol acetyltransferase [Mucilaginibacter achroorhodeus]
MKTKIDFATWERTDHFKFFNSFEESFFGATVNVDCTKAYAKAKELGISFFLYYLHCTLTAANKLKHFRYRVENGDVYLYDIIGASATVGRPNDTFGFSYIDYYPDLNEFAKHAKKEMERVAAGTGIELRPVTNVMHISAIPWLNFTGLTHARGFQFEDSMPKVSYGKMTEKDGIKTMPVSVTVHHGLVDGKHVGDFVALFQELLNA